MTAFAFVTSPASCSNLVQPRLSCSLSSSSFLCLRRRPRSPFCNPNPAHSVFHTASPSHPLTSTSTPTTTHRSTTVIHCQQRRRGSSGGGGGTSASDRLLSIVPYLLPLLDSLSFGKYVFAKVPILGQLLLPPLLPLYSIYRGIPFLAFGVFLALYILVVRNTNISRYIRFNTYQALFMDIALIIPQLFQSVSLPIPSTIAETCTTAVFYAAIIAVVYSVVRNAQGVVPDEIPAISEAVYQQLGPY